MSNWSDLFATLSPTSSGDRILTGATIRQARIDPCAFLQLILQGQAGHRPMAAAHRELQSHLSGQPRALVELPRDHGKTTQVCLHR